MSQRFLSSIRVAIAVLTLSAPVSAQKRSTIDAGALDAAVVMHVNPNRTVVTSALTSTGALAVAANMGLSAEAVSNRVAALNDAEVQKMAEQILAGGDSKIVVSTTAIIIALLVLILVTR
jgi:hypothetical protein